MSNKISESLSSFSWVFLDKASLQKTASYLEAMDEKGILDPMGFGILRDYFSNQLFPGVTVLHTRIKYVFFILVLLRKYCTAEGDYSSLGDLEFDLRSRLMEQLSKREPTGMAGIIGYTLKRLPAIRPCDIYWSCITTLKLLGDNAQLGRLEKIARTARDLRESEHKNDEDSGYESEQKISLERQIEELFGKVELALNEGRGFWNKWSLSMEQAEIMSNSYRNLENGSNLYITQLINEKKDYTYIKEFEKLPLLGNSNVRKAHNFSLLAGGIYKIFSYLLRIEVEKLGIHRDDREKLADSLIEPDSITEWQDHLLKCVNKQEIEFSEECVVAFRNSPKSPARFLNEVVNVLFDQGPWHKNIDALRKLIFDREIMYKTESRAKCRHPHELVNPGADLVDQSSYCYDFRWGRARCHIRDIRAGLLMEVKNDA